MSKPKDYNDYTAEDWKNQAKADEFDAQWDSNKYAAERKDYEGKADDES